MQIFWRPLAAAFLSVSMVACGASDPDTGTRTAAAGADDGSPGGRAVGDEAAARFGAADEWSARSTEGTEVLVHPETIPLAIGSVQFQITLPEQAGTAEAPAVTVDLVSPTMPMHGIRRFQAERTGPGSYTAAVTIPMAGEWILYVNLDAGGDAASFRITVPEGPGAAARVPESGAAHAHHGTQAGT